MGTLPLAGGNKMRINLSPVRLDEQLLLDVEGDVIMANGEEFDFSPLPDGATLPRPAILSDWFTGDVSRIDGELHLTIRLPWGANAPEETRFPVPIVVAEDGSVELPLYDIEPEVVEDEQHRLESGGDEGDEGSPGAGGAEDSGEPGTPEQEVGS